MEYPLEAIRARFPSLSISDSGRARVYLDNPAGTQVPDTVVQAMSACLTESNANIGGGFETSRRADAVVADAHTAMADFLNAASPAEIVFGQNMTTLTLHLSRSIGRLLTPGDEILLSRMDHDANVAPWLLLARDLELTVRWLPFDRDSFEFSPGALKDALTEKTKLVCVTGASNLIGTINDVKAMSRTARDAGALSYIDAVQLAPHAAIDVQDIDCDFLVCSAYKFFGPHQGILYGRRSLLERMAPYKVRPAPEALPGAYETGTQSHEGMAGTTAAVDYFAWVGETYAVDRIVGEASRGNCARAALGFLFDYEAELALRLIRGLESLPGVTVRGISEPEALDRRVPTVAFTADGHVPADIAAALAERNMFVWSGHSYAVEVVRHLGLDDAGGVVRVGPVHYNSAAEIDTLLAAVEDILQR